MQSEDVTLRRAKSRNVCRSSHDAHRYVVHLVDDDALTFHSLFFVSVFVIIAGAGGDSHRVGRRVDRTHAGGASRWGVARVDRRCRRATATRVR